MPIDLSWNQLPNRWRQSAAAAGYLAVFITLLLSAEVSCLSAERPVLTRADQIRILPRQDSITNYMVRLSGVITYHDEPWWADFFADETGGVFLNFPDRSGPLQAGDHVEVEGHVGKGGFTPVVEVEKIRRIGKLPFPTPKRLPMEQLIRGNHDSQWIEIQGVVHQALFADGHLVLKLGSNLRDVMVVVPMLDGSVPAIKHLVDSEVIVRGVAGTTWNQDSWRPGDLQPEGFRVLMPDLTHLEIQRASPSEPFELPERRIDQVMAFNPAQEWTHRVRTRGVITLKREDGVSFLQAGDLGIRVLSAEPSTAPVGAEVEVVGFPKVLPSGPLLEHALIRDTGRLKSVSPQPMHTNAFLGVQAGLLVVTNGVLADWFRLGRESILELRVGEQAFEVFIEAKGLPPRWLEDLTLGSLLEVTGVNTVAYDDRRQPLRLQMYAQDAASVRVLKFGPWFNNARLRQGLVVLGCAALGALVWVGLLRRQVRLQTRQIRRQYEERAAIERRFQDLAENANDLIYTLSPEGVLTSVNQVAERLTGFSRERLSGMFFRDLVIQEHRSRLDAYLQTNLKGSPDRGRMELDILGSEGRRLTLELSSRGSFTSGILSEIQGVARDITDRKRAEEAVKASEALLKSLAKGTASTWGAAFFERLATDLASAFSVRFVEVSVLGGVENTLLRSLVTCRDGVCVDGVVRPMLGSLAEDALTTPVVSRAERARELYPRDLLLQELHAEGCVCVSIRTTASVPRGFLTLIHDKPLADVERIQALLQIFAGRAGVELERLQFETSLREREQHYRSLVSSLVVGVILQDPQGRVIEVNDSACRILGLTREDFLDRTTVSPLWQTVREDGTAFPPEEYPSMRTALTGVPCHNVVMGVYRSPGDLCWISINSQAVFESDGVTVAASVASFEDITEVRMASQALKASEERYRLLVENSTDVLCELDLDGRFVYVSPNVHALLGHHHEDLMRQSPVEHLHPDESDRIRELFQTPASTATHRFRHTNGCWVWFETTARWFTTSAGEKRLALVSRDISRRVADQQAHDALEVRLRQSQKLEAIGTLAGGIAHDFNNIMGGILSNTELVQSSLPPSHPVQPQLAQIVRAILRARDVVRQLLTFSRKKEEVRQSVHLQMVIGEALELLRSALPSTTEIEAELGQTPIHVLAQPSQLHQIVMNLGVNASHAMASGGVLRVECDEVEIRPEMAARHSQLRPGPFARILFMDQGHGMRPETVERIFEPFFTTKGVGEGTGLGLSVVHGVVNSHEGLILVNSAPGQGTTFQVLLPLKISSDTGSFIGSPDRSCTLGEPVMYVDENLLAADFAKIQLVRLGCQASVFTSPKEALELFRSNPWKFDVLVLASPLATMDRRLFCDEVRSLRANMPILHALPHGCLNSPQSGAPHPFEKVLITPFTLARLSDALQQVRRGHTQNQPVDS